MKTTLFVLTIAMAAGTAFAQAPTTPPQGAAPAKPPQGPGLTLTTSAWQDGGIIPDKYTMQDPNNVSPKLEWSNVPANTVSFALIFHDPDTAIKRTTEDVLHWLVFNIPGTARELAEGIKPGQMPDGTIQAKSMRGQNAYMGPGAGPAGPYHHYTFELFALDTKLELTADATRADVLKAMDGHILGKGVVTGRFHRH